MLTGDYPRLHTMRRVWGALPSTALAEAGEILISADAASTAGIETSGLERRTLELRRRVQVLDAWVAGAGA